jgi:hypothetical protein
MICKSSHSDMSILSVIYFSCIFSCSVAMSFIDEVYSTNILLRCKLYCFSFVFVSFIFEFSLWSKIDEISRHVAYKQLLRSHFSIDSFPDSFPEMSTTRTFTAPASTPIRDIFQNAVDSARRIMREPAPQAENFGQPQNLFSDVREPVSPFAQLRQISCLSCPTV